MSILPFLLVLGLGFLALLVWSVFGVARQVHARRPVYPRHGIALGGSLAFFCVVWCLFFIVRAALLHSPHPYADSWPQCLAGVVVLLILPSVILFWSRRRRLRIRNNVSHERERA